jgi:hypothetical protein
MPLPKSMLIGATWLAATTLIAQAQAQYLPYPYYPANPYYSAPATPQSWSYDPYTSGLSPCPQWRHGDLRCRELMPPTHGQPDYRTR